MINRELINPESIVVVGGSNDTSKPGGKILKNIIEGGYRKPIFVINPKETEVQGMVSYPSVGQIPDADLAIIAIAAKYTLATIETLAYTKKTKAFIILSAGFSEESEEGKILEQKITEIVASVNGSLIGPNCIGILTQFHHSVFTEPIPKFDPKGVDFISGSGATAVFIMESAIPNGVTFSSLFSVGNSAQIGVEEVLAYLDETFDPELSSRVKILYVESINKPQLLLKHAVSLIRKGCRIAAVKSGASEAGSRAASSHTGALASSDVAVDALFRKAGITRCYGRNDLITTASVMLHPELKGPGIAIITHAGGPAVMLTDALSNGGLKVPSLSHHPASPALLSQLFSGSSVANPIDFLATGTAAQLSAIIDHVDQKYNDIDGMAVIFGTPGLVKVFDAYTVIDEKMKTCTKPIFPILPSVTTAKEEVDFFLSQGRINFPDEVLFGQALAKVYHTPKPAVSEAPVNDIDFEKIRNIIVKSENGYLSPDKIQILLDASGIPRAGEAVVNNREDAAEQAASLGFPVVMKVIGPIHKSDVGGVRLNVKTVEEAKTEFDRMIQIPDTTAILIQPMLSGTELFAGAKYEPKFGHMVLFGMGGIFIEVFKDVTSALCPLSKAEAVEMIRNIKSYKIIRGVRNQAGIDENRLVEILLRLSALLKAAPEIAELDLNPLLASSTSVIAVDARIRIEKNQDKLN